MSRMVLSCKSRYTRVSALARPAEVVRRQFFRVSFCSLGREPITSNSSLDTGVLVMERVVSWDIPEMAERLSAVIFAMVSSCK